MRTIKDAKLDCLVVVVLHFIVTFCCCALVPSMNMLNKARKQNENILSCLTLLDSPSTYFTCYWITRIVTKVCTIFQWVKTSKNCFLWISWWLQVNIKNIIYKQAKVLRLVKFNICSYICKMFCIAYVSANVISLPNEKKFLSLTFYTKDFLTVLTKLLDT